MQNTLYLSLLPVGLGMISLVLGMIGGFGYFTSNDIDTKRRLYPWMTRFLLAAFLLLSIGIFFTAKHFF